MNKKLLDLLAFCALFFVCSNLFAGPDVPKLMLDHEGPIYQLSGQWLVTPIGPNNEASDFPISSTPRMTSSGLNPIGAYKMEAKIEVPPALQGKPLSLLFLETKTAINFKIWYSNSLPVAAAMGQYSPSPDKYRALEVPQMIALGASQASTINLELLVSNFVARESGITGFYYVGESKDIQEKHLALYLSDGILAGILFFGALYHLFLFFIKRRDFSSLMFALLCLFQAFLASTNTNFLMEFFYNLGIPWSVSKAVFENIPSYTFSFLYILYMQSMFKKYTPIFLSRYACWGSIFFALFIIFTPNSIHGSNLVFAIGYLGVLISIISCLYIAIKAARGGEKTGGYTIMGLIFLSLSTVYDILVYKEVIDSPLMTPIGMIVFIASQSLVLGYQYNRSFVRVSQLSKELDESNQFKQRVIANTSHELRTPLNAIINLSQSTRAGLGTVDETETEEVLSVIEKSGTRLLGLVENMLLTGTENKKLSELNKTEFKIDVLIRRVCVCLEPNAKKQNIDLITKIDSDTRPVIADEDKIEQVLINLVFNAIKFTPKGSVSIIAKNTDGDRVRISVVDTGIGIPHDKRSFIFEPYSQLVSTSRIHYGGMGLGLSIAKDIITAHNSTIELQSELGKGSTFSFTI